MLLYVVCTAGEVVWNESSVLQLPAPYITLCDFLKRINKSCWNSQKVKANKQFKIKNSKPINKEYRMLAGFLAKDCHEGIWTCNLWVGVLIGSYRRAIDGGTLEFPGQVIALLLVARWLECWCASLAAVVRFLACPVQRQLLQGVIRSCCCHTPRFCVLHA